MISVGGNHINCAFTVKAKAVAELRNQVCRFHNYHNLAAVETCVLDWISLDCRTFKLL